MTTEARPAAIDYQMFINGTWEEASSAERFTRYSPYDGESVGTYPDGDVADADRAIATARRVFDESGWSTSPARERAQILERAAALLQEHRDEFTRSIIQEVGKPVWMAEREVPAAAGDFLNSARLALAMKGDAITQQTPGAIGMTIQEPIGVVGVITPWNYPLILVGRKIGSAIAAGCTVVCKPSHYTSGSALILARLLAEAGLPDGVLNIVTSARDNGATVGQRISASEQVDMVTFTGSTASGKAVMRAAANNVKKLALELGGKSPNIIFDDASLDDAATGAIAGVFNNSGQICQAGSRILVSNRIKDQFLERLLRLTEQLTMGDPADRATKLGPLVNETQLKRVEGYLERGRGEARVLTGGHRASDAALAGGYFVEPTVFDDVPPGSSIAREEIFGPVVSVIGFDDVEEAISIGNDTIYGLAAAVWTKDIDVAFRVAKGLRAGTIWVNCYHGAGVSGQPFGGYKQSGLGREFGEHGISEFLETKSIQIKLA